MKNILLIVVSFLLIPPVFAESSALETARKNIAQQLNGVNPKNITASAIPGLYQVAIPPRIFYVSADGRYLMTGDLIDTKTKFNVSKSARNQSIATSIKAIGEDSMIIFGDDSLKHTITVFTDIDCSYCRKLHNEIKDYNKLGIRVRYMSYPRAGVGSGAFKMAENVWCSKDRKKALTKAKSGGKVKNEQCSNPVAKHYELGNLIGIRGTPAIILESGELVSGYVPALQLSQILDRAKN